MHRFSMMVALSAMTLVAGCNGDPDDSGATDSGDSCTNVVSKTFPQNGETQAYYRAPIEAELDDAEADATLTVVDAAGAEVAGTVAIEDERVIFTPSSPLAPSTEYTATVSYSCGETPFSFTTSEVGAAIADPSTLVGKTYELDLSSGRFIEPAGVESLIGEFIGGVTVLVSPTALDGTSLTMTGALGAEGASPPEQAECTPTIPFPTADFSSNPYFQVGPGPAVIAVEGITVNIDNLEVTGAFAPDTTYISGASLRGLIDTRPLASEFIEDGGDDAICELAGTIGVACEACPEDGEAFCLSIYVTSMSALAVDASITLYHGPDEAAPQEGSVDYCTLDECAAEDACQPPPAK